MSCSFLTIYSILKKQIHLHAGADKIGTRAVQKTLVFSNNYEKALFCCSCSQKISSQNSSRSQRARPHSLFFGSLIQVKFRKMAFLARSFHFMFLEPCSFNTNGRKAFRLFWASKLCDHTQQVFWQRPIFYR